MAQIPFIQKLKGTHTVGLYTVFLFLAVIRAYCEIGTVMELQEMGWTLFSFTSLAVFYSWGGYGWDWRTLFQRLGYGGHR